MTILQKIKKLKKYSPQLRDEIIKCIVYQNNTNELSKWVRNISKYLYFANTITVDMKKFPEKVYRKTIFESLGHSVEDTENNIIQFQIDNNLDFEITQSLINRVHRYTHFIVNGALPKFTSINNLKYSDFEEIVWKCVNFFVKE